MGKKTVVLVEKKIEFGVEGFSITADGLLIAHTRDIERLYRELAIATDLGFKIKFKWGK